MDSNLIEISAKILGALASAGILLALARHLWQIPRVLREHDGSIQRGHRRYRDWVNDRNARLTRELREADEDANRRGLFDSSIRLDNRAAAKSAALREYRDEQRQLIHVISEAKEREHFTHHIARVLIGTRLHDPVWAEIEPAPVSEWQEPEQSRNLDWTSAVEDVSLR